MTRLNAPNGQFSEHVLPMDDLSLIVLDDLFGRSFFLQKIYLSMVCQKMACRCEAHEIPKDGQSLNVLDGPNGRSFLLLCQKSFCLSKVYQKKDGQFLEHVIPTDDLSLILLDDLFGRSFLLQKICLSMVCQKMACRCEVHEIPKDGLSLNELDGPNGRSFLRLYQMSFYLSKDGRKKDGQFLERVIPKDGQIEMLAYARLLNLNRVSRYKKVCLTSSFFPGGRRLVLQCAVYLTTRALEHGRQILEHRRSFWCRALRGHLLCDEACDLIQF